MFIKDEDKTPKATMVRVEKIDGYCSRCQKMTIHDKINTKYRCLECNKIWYSKWSFPIVGETDEK